MIIPDNLRHHNLIAFFTERREGSGKDAISGLSGIPEEHIFFPVQEHTDRVVLLGDLNEKVTADGVITGRCGVLLGVVVADCIPILIYDKRLSVISAVHTGWRGTAGGILKKALMILREIFSSRSEDILIAFGPSIRWCCYKVGTDVLEAVKAETGPGEYSMIRDGDICLDLASANRVQAVSAGIPDGNIWTSEECTFCYPERFFSYRYSKVEGRQGGFIVMKD